MTYRKKRSMSPARWLWCLLLVLTLVPASSVGARRPIGVGPSSLTATPNPVIIPFGTETGTTTIAWNSGSDIVPELWVASGTNGAEWRLPIGNPARSGSATLTVQMGQSTTVNLYLPGHSLLLNSVLVTTQHPGGAAVSNLPPPTLAPVPGAFNKVSLQPSSVNSPGRRHTEFGGSLICATPDLRYGSDNDPPLPWDTITVGYMHYYDDSCDLDDVFWRGAVQFDLSSLTYHHFLSATLTFSVTDGLRYDPDTDLPGGPYHTGTRWSAAAGMDRATDNWAGWPAGEDHDYINGDGAHFFVPSGYLRDPTITLDVTSTVRDWLEGNKPNYGFVFFGFDEGFPKNNSTYLSNYSGFTLTLHYF